MDNLYIVAAVIVLGLALNLGFFFTRDEAQRRLHDVGHLRARPEPRRLMVLAAIT